MPRIAWIEDDIDIIDALVRPLERAQFKIDRYRDTSEARAQLQQILKADLILLDAIIPPDVALNSAEGLEFLRWLRRQESTLPPVIIVTVVTDPEILSQFQAEGVADIVRKPVLPSALKAKVEEVLARPSAG